MIIRSGGIQIIRKTGLHSQRPINAQKPSVDQLNAPESSFELCPKAIIKLCYELMPVLSI